MLCGAFAFAQNRVVSGKVTDADGNAVAFASVKLRGSKTGVSADANGAFTIRAKTGDVLEVSGTGYITKEFPVGSGSSINASL